MNKRILSAALLVSLAALVFAQEAPGNKTTRQEPGRLKQGVPTLRTSPAKKITLKREKVKLNNLKVNGGKPVTASRNRLMKQDVHRAGKQINPKRAVNPPVQR